MTQGLTPGVKGDPSLFVLCQIYDGFSHNNYFLLLHSSFKVVGYTNGSPLRQTRDRNVFLNYWKYICAAREHLKSDVLYWTW